MAKQQGQQGRGGSGTIQQQGQQNADSAATRGPVSNKDVNGQDVQEEIAKVAYDIFEKRGYQHGSHVEDWVEAEKIVLAKIEASQQ
jgi:hypothetical protein